MSGGNESWCILRTSAARTLPLARSLAEADFEVWTPVAKVVTRTPRTRDRVERDVPMMPTFVFARAGRLVDLLRERALPGSKHPPFSVFRYSGRFPIVADSEVASLRRAETASELAARKSRTATFAVGQAVRPTEGPFAGLSGVIEKREGKFALVCFDGAFRVKIEGWQLPSDMAQVALP